jgi:hypothetical protein
MAVRNQIRIAPDGLPEVRTKLSVPLRDDQRTRIQLLGERAGIIDSGGKVPRAEVLRLLLVIAATPRASVDTRASYALRANLTYTLASLGKRLASLYPTGRTKKDIGVEGMPANVAANLGSWLREQMRMMVGRKLASGYDALYRCYQSILDDALSDPGCEAVFRAYGRMTFGLRREFALMEQKIAKEVRPMVEQALAANGEVAA